MIPVKTSQEIAIMQEGGKILAEILKKLSDKIKPGVATKELEKLASELVLFYKVKPAFLKYRGYPAMACISINDEIVHGVPSDRVIMEGDIVSIDFGIKFKGFFVDSAVSVIAGEGAPEARNLLRITKEALSIGIKEAMPGKYTGDIGHAIQRAIETNGLTVIRELVGHGIGRELHEKPHIPNFGKKGEGAELKEGIVIAIEPMASMGDWRVKFDKKNLAYKTKDGSLSAHFEHTVAITNKGPLVLTI